MEQSAKKLIRKFLQNGAGTYRTIVQVLTAQKITTDDYGRCLLDRML